MTPDFSKFERTYQNSIKRISDDLKPNSHGIQIHGLFEWMLQTDANPYTFLPRDLANEFCRESAESFARILDIIHHAFYDDGELEFISINGRPGLVFFYRNNPDFYQSILESYSLDIHRNPPVIKVLDINPNEFGPFMMPGMFRI